ncbi:hypothetical protein KP509_26G047600 [Ceratopteris richardii]|uniref:Uncharacterized protein n=1 Tax=Ceratopteris richardii TaxID=49495 RepID=A0A8T2RMT2_CERRI|nr:hypothetical protein KP509_26G047600 [Ceratopteris richardii]
MYSRSSAMEELKAAPRTLDVQQFARARAHELLSLHSALKFKKRRDGGIVAEQHEVGSLRCIVDGGDVVDGGDQTENASLSRITTNLPRHLRRRTSSYSRRRRPLPWLYKRKVQASVSPHLLSSRPKKRRKRQQQRKHETDENHQDALSRHIVFHTEVREQDRAMGALPFTPSTTIIPGGPHQGTANPQQTMEWDSISLPQETRTSVFTSIETHNQNTIKDLDVKCEAPLENIEVVSICTDMNCIMNDEEVAVFQSNVDSKDESVINPAITNLRSAGSLQGDLTRSQGNEGNVLDSTEWNINVPIESIDQVAQAGVNQTVGDILCAKMDAKFTLSIQEENREDPNKVALKFSQEDTEGRSVLKIDGAEEDASHAVQLGQSDGNSSVASKTPLFADILASENQKSSAKVDGTKKRKNISRPLRRLLEFKRGGSLISSDGSRRLATHVWHAKRFSIEKIWGYRIPLGRHGRGQGSRSVLQWSRSKALLHDCSFINAIQLQGTKKKIIQVLKSVLELPEGIDTHFENGGRGKTFTTAILHHPDRPLHEVIAPITLMWKPSIPEISTFLERRDENEYEKSSELWLWVHAAAFEEAYQALKDICFQMNGQTVEDTITCFSRKGHLGRLDLVGEKSSSVLHKALYAIYRNNEGRSIRLESLTKSFDLEQVKGGSVLYLEVCDPRLKESERCLAIDPVSVSPVAVFDDRGSMLELVGESRKSAEADVQPEGGYPDMFGGTLSSSHEETCNMFWNRESMESLWRYDGNSCEPKFRQPLSEEFLSKMRHTDRLQNFGLAKCATDRMSERRKHLSSRFSCPIILLRDDHEKPSACGWSIILPLCWVSAFWVPLVFAGGHVIGIRERHWLCTDAGMPSFPEDFPDCKPFKGLESGKAILDFLPSNKSFTIEVPILEQTSQHVEGKPRNQVSHISSMSNEADQEKAGSEFFVARRSEQLVSYFQRTKQRSLLLFPTQKKTWAKFKGLDARLREGTVVWQMRTLAPRANIVHHVQSSCLLRVCLRPVCKGVAKVGAIVYIPTPEDYLALSCGWQTRVKSPSESERVLGYVTSMAPRGSKSSAAIAFCDAIGLGWARQQQWLNTTCHKKGPDI